jgi:hypothetical protein
MKLALSAGMLALAVVATGLGLAVEPSSVPARQPYRPVTGGNTVVYGGGYGGWGGGGAGTAASANAYGMAAVINAAGQANLANSAAANNWEAAYSADLNNRLQATNTYFEMRRVNKEDRAAEQSPRVTAEELARFAKEAAPARLTASQLDPVSGEIGWPMPLRDARYEVNRKKIEQMFASREANAGSVETISYRQLHDAIEILRAQLVKNIAEYAPQNYVEARKFLDSLEYEAGYAG